MVCVKYKENPGYGNQIHHPNSSCIRTERCYKSFVAESFRVNVNPGSSWELGLKCKVMYVYKTELRMEIPKDYSPV